MDRRPTEEQAQAGELAGFIALGTHEACQCPSGGPALLRVWTGRNTAAAEADDNAPRQPPPRPPAADDAAPATPPAKKGGKGRGGPGGAKAQ
jgi:hypothetical protein